MRKSPSGGGQGGGKISLTTPIPKEEPQHGIMLLERKEKNTALILCKYWSFSVSVFLLWHLY